MVLRISRCCCAELLLLLAAYCTCCGAFTLPAAAQCSLKQAAQQRASQSAVVAHAKHNKRVREGNYEDDEVVASGGSGQMINWYASQPQLALQTDSIASVIHRRVDAVWQCVTAPG
jgi:hypothetical protein